MTASPNHALLTEANRAGTWFHARKTRPIWARELDADQTVQTIEGPMNARAGDFLCRGEAGDIWPQKAKTLNERYVRTETVTAEGWRQYQPRPDAEGVMAFQVNHPFNVVTTWGQQTGKPGDFLLKNHRDRDVAEPVDVWIVDQRLFRATYEPVRR